MVINLTDLFVEDAESIEYEDARILEECFRDEDRVEEAALILSNYEASIIYLDVDTDYFTALQEELPNTTLVLGVPQ